MRNAKQIYGCVLNPRFHFTILFVNADMKVSACIGVLVYICVYIYIYIYMCVCVCVCVCVKGATTLRLAS